MMADNINMWAMAFLDKSFLSVFMDKTLPASTTRRGNEIAHRQECTND